MHSNLTFRATVKAHKQDPPKRSGNKGEALKDSTGNWTVYCADFNQGVCPFDDHHEGVFNRKSVTKWHVCRKCLAQEGHPRCQHPESECTNEQQPI